MLKKIVSFVNQMDPSYKSIMDFIEGKERICGRVTRPGFRINENMEKENCCIFFCVLPYEASINRCFHTEFNGAIKCTITTLRPWQYAVISGMIDEQGENLPNYIISFNGVHARVQEQNEFNFDEFKEKTKEFFEKRGRTGMSPQLQDFMTEIRSAQADFALRESGKSLV